IRNDRLRFYQHLRRNVSVIADLHSHRNFADSFVPGPNQRPVAQQNNDQKEKVSPGITRHIVPPGPARLPGSEVQAGNRSCELSSPEKKSFPWGVGCGKSQSWPMLRLRKNLQGCCRRGATAIQKPWKSYRRSFIGSSKCWPGGNLQVKALHTL